MSGLRIGVLAYSGCLGSEVFGIPDLLAVASHVAEARGAAAAPFEVTVVGARQEVSLVGGSTLVPSRLRPVDVLVVPGFDSTPRVDLDAALAELSREQEAIRAQRARGGAVVSICVGAFLLADAGILDGREVTTSWLFADRLARRRPAALVRPDELVITDGGVTTTAAFSAMYDYALNLITSHSGPGVARRTARITLVDDARASQSPYVDGDPWPAVEHPFSEGVKRHLEKDLAARYDLRRLADALHISTRTLLRRFARETGRTPLHHLQSARIESARRLLESTERTVASIALEVGYSDPSTFSALFARYTGRRPGEYRATFAPRARQATTSAQDDRLEPQPVPQRHPQQNGCRQGNV